jgi:hypothetical protein
MPDPLSSASRRDHFWTEYDSQRDDFRVEASEREDVSMALQRGSNPEATGGVFRVAPGQLQYLPTAVAKLLQPVFERLAESNGGRRLDVSTVPFIVKDLGAAKAHTVRGVVEISPGELTRPLEKQLYIIGHELTHVLQFDAIGAAGADADTRWTLMVDRYASEARGEGRGSQYDVPADLSVGGLNVVDPRFTLESMAVRVGREAQGRLYDR